MANIKHWLFGAFATCLVMFTGCNKSQNSQNSLSECDDYVYADSVSNTHVYGFVYDADGNPISNVLVTSGKDSVLTSINGGYSINKCHAVNGRCIVKFEEQEYFSVIRTADIVKGESRVDAILMPQESKEGVSEITRFENSQGTVIKIGKMSVAIPANSLVYESDGTPFNGSVFASTYYLNPNSENFAKEMPGGDMSGVTSDGKNVILLSYGMVEVTLKDSANRKLQLKEGTESTLTFPVPEGYTEDQKHEKIPLWYFDEEKGTWIEEGVATKKGDLYSGTVKHFSWHNIDYPSMRATIKGRVTNKNGVPLPNVLVTISQTSAYTDDQGYYSAFVPNYTPVFVTVKPSDYASYTNCPIYNVDGLSGGTEYTQDIVLPIMPCIRGKVTSNDGNPVKDIEITTGKSTTMSNDSGDYTIYYSGNEPFALSVSEYMTVGNRKTKKYEFNDPSEIDESISYDFVVDNLMLIRGYVCNSDGTNIDKGIVVTALVDNKEYKIKASAFGLYTMKVSQNVKEITTYVKAEDGYGAESNRASCWYSYYMQYIRIPIGASVYGSISNSCGPSKANVTLTLGKGKNKRNLSQSTKFGNFLFRLPAADLGANAKVKIDCQGKRFKKNIDINQDRINLGRIEICSGEKPDPNCIYAIVGDKTIKFDTEKDLYTEMFKKADTDKYQVWFKNPDYNGFLVLEIENDSRYRYTDLKFKKLACYFIYDGISIKQDLRSVRPNKKEIYRFNTDFELSDDSDGDDAGVYLYGSADIKNKYVHDNMDLNYISNNIYLKSTKILCGSTGTTKFYTLTLPKESTKELESVLKSKGYKEKSTFMDDEQRITTIFLQDNAEALIHRNKDNTSDATIMIRKGIGSEPLYQCWKVDFKNSSLKNSAGSNINYMWKNEADIAQLIMFGPIMGVKFTKTDISEQKCGCTTSGPAVAN